MSSNGRLYWRALRTKVRKEVDPRPADAGERRKRERNSKVRGEEDDEVSSAKTGDGFSLPTSLGSWADMVDQEERLPPPGKPSRRTAGTPPKAKTPPRSVREELVSLLGADRLVKRMIEGVAERAAAGQVAKERSSMREWEPRGRSRERVRRCRSPSPTAAELRRENMKLQLKVDQQKGELERFRQAFFEEQERVKRFKAEAEAAQSKVALVEDRLTVIVSEMLSCRMAALESKSAVAMYMARVQTAEKLLAEAGIELPPHPKVSIPDLPPVPNVARSWRQGRQGWSRPSRSSQNSMGEPESLFGWALADNLSLMHFLGFRVAL
ncbi:hypothetical protein ABPG77_000146 [Micractinium sp. CCAP 211/92]